MDKKGGITNTRRYTYQNGSIMYETEIRKQIKTNFDYSSVTEKIRNV